MMQEEKPVSTAAARAKRWRQRNPEAYKASKERYYASEKGKLQKRKSDAAYKASGKRAITEAKREAKPISDARKQARLRYQLMRRSGEKMLDDLSLLVLSEAVQLAKLRNKMCGCKWHVDHVIPVSKGGQSIYDNIQVVPAYWNRTKSNTHTERFFACAS
jgi:5-methylcytosine-specific restriction endonuclease McrA